MFNIYDDSGIIPSYFVAKLNECRINTLYGGDIQADSLEIGSISSETANIGTVAATNISSINLTGNNTTAPILNSTTATITTLNNTTGNITTGNIPTLNTTNGNITNVNATNLNFGNENLSIYRNVSNNINVVSPPAGITANYFTSGIVDLNATIIGSFVSLSLKGDLLISNGTQNLVDLLFDNTTLLFQLFSSMPIDSTIVKYFPYDGTKSNGEQLDRKMVIYYDGSTVKIEIFKLNITSAPPNFMQYTTYIASEPVINNDNYVTIQFHTF